MLRIFGRRKRSAASQRGANDVCGTGSINAINACIEAAGKDLPDPTEALIRQICECIENAGVSAALRDPYYNILSRHRAKALRAPELELAAGK